MANFYYADKKPKERIALIVEHHILPEIKSLGFRFRKTNLTLTRTVGDFQQEIWFRPSRNNIGNIIVEFDPHFSVTSSVYDEWLKENYDNKQTTPIGVGGGNRAEYVPGWIKKKYDGWYNLAKVDNDLIIQIVIKNIRKAGISYMDRFSGWDSAADYYVENPGYHFWPKAIDFCLLNGNTDKAISISKAYWEQAKGKDLSHISNSMYLRESKMESLGLIKIDPSHYSGLPKNLQGKDRVFLNSDELQKRKLKQKKKDDENLVLHRKSSNVQDGTIAFHVATPLPVSSEDLETFQSKQYGKRYEPQFVKSNLRFRVNDISWNSSLKLLATAHDEATGVLWDEKGEVVNVLDFSKQISTVTSSIGSVVSVEEAGFAFCLGYSYHIYDPHQYSFHIYNNTKKVTNRNCYFTIDPYFGECITAGFGEGKVLSWNYKGEIISEQNFKDGFIPQAFNPQREIFLLCTDKGARRIVSRDNKILFEYKGVRDSSLFVFSPDGRFLVEAGHSSKIAIVDIPKLEVKELKAHPTNKKGYAKDFDFANFGTNMITISPDSKFLVAGCDYGIDVMWQLETLDRIELKGHRLSKDLFQDGTAHIEFSDDGKTFLTANKDATVIVRDIHDNIHARLVGHTKAVKKAIFGSNAKTIFTIADDLEMRKWRMME